MCSNNVPVSHCKDTYYFDKTNNYFKKSERKGDQVSGLLCPKLTELLYTFGHFIKLCKQNNGKKNRQSFCFQRYWDAPNL